MSFLRNKTGITPKANKCILKNYRPIHLGVNAISE